MSTAVLSDFCEIIAGGRKKWTGKDFVESGFPAFGAGGINGQLPEAEFDQPAVVLSSIGARCGKCFIAEGRWSSLANTQLIFPDPQRADPRFLWYQLNDEARWPRSGTGQPFIKTAHIKAHEVHLPPIEEQRRIAAVLDAADALRATRRQALAKLDTLTQAIFIDMFGDAKGKPVVDSPFGDHFTLQRGYDLPVQNRVEGEFEVWAANGPVGTHEIAKVKGPGVVTGRSGTVGKVHFVAGDFWPLNTALYVKDFHGNDPRYCAELLRNFDLGRFSRGVGVPTLNRNLVHDAPVRVAPQSAQAEFRTRTENVDRAISRQQAQLTGLDELFASLQQRAFRGEL